MKLFTTKKEQELLDKINELEITIRGQDRANESHLSNCAYIESLELEISSLREANKTYAHLKDSEKYLEKQLQSWKETAGRFANERDSALNELRDSNEIIASLQQEKATLIGANKELSKTQLKADEWNNLLNETGIEVEKLKTTIDYTQAIADDLSKQLLEEKEKNKSLLETIISFKREEPILVKNEVIQPQIIEPIVLSPKTK